MTHTYIPALLSAITTLELALYIHPHRNQDGVVRKTARRLVHKQEGLGKEYLQLLIASQHPYTSLTALQSKLGELQ